MGCLSKRFLLTHSNTTMGTNYASQIEYLAEKQGVTNTFNEKYPKHWSMTMTQEGF